MRIPDDKDKENTNEENINGAECERKQGNGEGRHCKKEEKENINGAECERKQGNDEGRHCNNTQFLYSA